MARISAPSTSPEAQTPKSYIFIQAHRVWADLFLVFPRVKSPVLDQAFSQMPASAWRTTRKSPPLAFLGVRHDDEHDRGAPGAQFSFNAT